MNRTTAAQTFEQELTASLSGASSTLHPDSPGLDGAIQIANGLRGLTAEWKRLPSPALKREVASVVARVHEGVEHRATSQRVLGRSVLRFGMAATAAITVIILAVPAARQGVARQLYRVLDVVAVGPSTDIVRSDVRTPAEVSSSLRQFDRQLASGRGWHLSTPYGGFGGGVPAGASPATQRVDRLELVGALTPMTVQLPAFTYRGAVPVFNHALVAPDGLLLVFLGSDERELLIVQAPVGSGGSISYSRVISDTDEQGRLTTHSPELKTEALVLNEQSVTWDPDTTGRMPNSSALRWERDGISYSLMGRGLKKDEAVQLFLSLRPVATSRPQ